MVSNAAGSSEAGASDDKVAAIECWRESELFSPAERAALAVAEGMSVTPVDITDEVFEEARRHFSEAEMVELVATISMENYRARFNRAFLVEAVCAYHPR
jgi:alkylhydroperoxidase family enzyme